MGKAFCLPESVAITIKKPSKSDVVPFVHRKPLEKGRIDGHEQDERQLKYDEQPSCNSFAKFVRGSVGRTNFINMRAVPELVEPELDIW